MSFSAKKWRSKTNNEQKQQLDVVENLVIDVFDGNVDVVINGGHECFLLTIDALQPQTQLSQLCVTLVSTLTQQVSK